MQIMLSIEKTCMIQILMLLVLSSYTAHSQVPSFLFELRLPFGTAGPEALALDINGTGPYTGVSDGRILKYGGPNIGYVDFATTTPLRIKAICDRNPLLQIVCGRPLGLGFYYKTGDLYMVDINYGLLSVGPRGGLATQLVAGFGGLPFAFPDALDIDQELGIIYFADSGAIFRTGNIQLIILSGDTTGRLFKYDTRTKQVTLLLSGLSGPAGVALSKDGSYLLVTEYIAKRIRRFWLKGAKANSSEVFANLEGHPDNIKRTVAGDFWVAVNVVKLRLLIPDIVSLGQRINEFGNVVVSLNLTDQFRISISEVQEHLGRLYVGSLLDKKVGVYGV